jgi:hypothetical protein
VSSRPAPGARLRQQPCFPNPPSLPPLPLPSCSAYEKDFRKPAVALTLNLGITAVLALAVVSGWGAQRTGVWECAAGRRAGEAALFPPLHIRHRSKLAGATPAAPELIPAPRPGDRAPVWVPVSLVTNRRGPRAWQRPPERSLTRWAGGLRVAQPLGSGESEAGGVCATGGPLPWSGLPCMLGGECTDRLAGRWCRIAVCRPDSGTLRGSGGAIGACGRPAAACRRQSLPRVACRRAFLCSYLAAHGCAGVARYCTCSTTRVSRDERRRTHINHKAVAAAAPPRTPPRAGLHVRS